MNSFESFTWMTSQNSLASLLIQRSSFPEESVPMTKNTFTFILETNSVQFKGDNYFFKKIPVDTTPCPSSKSSCWPSGGRRIPRQGQTTALKRAKLKFNKNDIVTTNGFTFRKISAFVPSRSKQLKSGISSQYFPFSLQGNNHIHLSELCYLLAWRLGQCLGAFGSVSLSFLQRENRDSEKCSISHNRK